MKNFLPIIVFLVGLLVSASQAQREGWYEFHLPWNDSTRSITDVGHLVNDGPAGNHGFLHIGGDGHFYFDDGTRARFLGTNTSFGGSLPTHKDAEQIARRMAKFGFNILRCHHMDTQRYPDGLIDDGYADSRHLDPDGLDRLGYFICQLKNNGIYSDLNLHVGRTFTAADGIPCPGDLKPYAKFATYFEPRLLDLQKEYARTLLTYFNPYTNLRFCDDPAVALVEITNENSLLQGWLYDALDGDGGGSHDLSGCYVDHLDSLWNAWLIGKYGHRDTLASAWSQGQIPPGAEMVRDGGFEGSIGSNWQLEIHQPAAASYSKDASTRYGGSASVKLNVTAATGTSWHLQFKQVNQKIEDGKVYRLSFWAKASAPRTMNVAVMKNNSPWNGYGLWLSVDLTQSWTFYTASFEANGSDPNDVRLTFEIGGTTGTIWLDEVSYSESQVTGLAPEEDPWLGNVRRLRILELDGYTDRRAEDLTRFYYDLEQTYLETMRSFISDSLGVRVPVTGTNNYYGLVSILSQSAMEYMDAHAYWQHPWFPNEPWDPSDWLITNTPMVDDDRGGTISELAKSKVIGLPLTISEYNEPAPSFYQCEFPLILGSYAALQDWDGLFIYSYHHGPEEWERRQISSYFDVDSNPIIMSLLPAIALLYLRADVSPAMQSIGLRHTEQETFLSMKTYEWDEGFHVQGDLHPAWALVHRLERETFASPEPVFYAHGTPPHPYTSDTGELAWDAGLGLVTVNSRNTQGVTGRIGDIPIELDNIKIFPRTLFATIVLTSLDSLAIAESGSLLLSAVSRAENTDMIWNADSTSVSNNWGHAPVLMQPVEATIVLSLAAPDEIAISPLSPAGEPNQWIPLLPDSSGAFAFEMNGSYRTPWYAIRVTRNGQPGMKGDVNHDGEINIVDIILTVNHILETAPLPPGQVWTADVNEDEKIDIIDVMGIVLMILGDEHASTLHQADGMNRTSGKGLK